jgi:hypothetical protein
MVTQVDVSRPAEHVERTVGRLSALGVETLVFGSGKARQVPEGFSREEALSQLVAFGRLAAEAASRTGIVVVLEPLRRQETNIINTAREGLALVDTVGLPRARGRWLLCRRGRGGPEERRECRRERVPTGCPCPSVRRHVRPPRAPRPRPWAGSRSLARPSLHLPAAAG